jgi:hypothetical protein
VTHPSIQVIISLTGAASGTTHELQLANGTRCSLTTGSTMQDWLCLGSAEPSGFSRVRVWHDGQGYASAWLLEWLLLQHMRSGEWWQYAVSNSNSSGSSSSTGWIKGGGVGSARELRLVASGLQENCPLPALTAEGLRQQFELLHQSVGQPSLRQTRDLQAQQQEQQQHQPGVEDLALGLPAVHVPAAAGSTAAAAAGTTQTSCGALAAAAVACGSDGNAAAGSSHISSTSGSGNAVSRSNPFAVAFDAAAACDPAVAEIVGDGPAVAYSGSNNPFDDGFPTSLQQQLEATVAAVNVADIWPQQQQQHLELPDNEVRPLDLQQQQLPNQDQLDWQQQQQQQPVVQLPAIRLLQAQRCDVSYDEELQTFTPLSHQTEQQQQQQDSDVFTYMPAAAVLEQQDRQLWPRRTASWQRHQEEPSQQQVIEQSQQQQLSGQQNSKLQFQQAELSQQEQQARAAGSVVACSVLAAAANAVADPDLSADFCSADDDAAQTAALAAAAPLDDIELKHRGSPRCCQAQTQSQQQQLRQLVAVRRTHSCEAEPAGLSSGSHTQHPGKHANCSGSAGSKGQLPLRRVCSSDAEGTAAAAAPGSPMTVYSSDNSSRTAGPGQSSSPKSRRQAAAAAAEPCTPDPPPYSKHLLYDSASSALSKPLQQSHSESPSRAAAYTDGCTDRTAAAAGGTGGKASRRVSGTAGMVRLVPLVDFDDSSSEPSSSSRSSSASDTDQASHAADTSSSGSSSGSCKVSRQDSGRSQQGRVMQRLPTPKASLTGDEGEELQAAAAAAADESAAETDTAAAAVASAAANSLVAGVWQQQQQQQGGRPCSAAKAVRFCEWVEQLEFGGRGCGSDDDDSSSVESFTEEQLLEAQVRPW